MSHQGTLYLLCGKMAAGKSTLARELANSRHAILLSEDQLLADLYPNEVQDVASYVRCSTRLKEALESHIGNLLSRGVSVVLERVSQTSGRVDVLVLVSVVDLPCPILRQRSVIVKLS